MGMLNAKVQVNSILSVGMEYRFGYGLMQIEKDIDQKTKNISHSLLFSLGFSLDGGTNSRFR